MTEPRRINWLWNTSQPAAGNRQQPETRRLGWLWGQGLTRDTNAIGPSKRRVSFEPVRLGHDGESGEAVTLGNSERTKGLYIIGNPGMGKSSLLEDLIVQDIEAGAGVCVLDPHGDLFEHVLGRVPADRADDVVLIDLK